MLMEAGPACNADTPLPKVLMLNVMLRPNMLSQQTPIVAQSALKSSDIELP